MVFAIYSNGQWNNVDVEIEPVLTKAKDTTNDTFSCVLKANKEDLPIPPMTPFRITDGTTNTIMWITNDEVGIFSTYPLLYKHSLSLVQYRYFLNKHMPRNTIFNQPRKDTVKLFASLPTYMDVVSNDYVSKVIRKSTDQSIAYWTDIVKLSKKAKVKEGKYRIKFLRTYIDNLTYDTQLVDSFPQEDNIKVADNSYFTLCDQNNGNYVILDHLDIEKYNDEVYFTEAQIIAINNYLTNHDNVQLILGYSKQDNNALSTVGTFVDVIDPSKQVFVASIIAQIYLDLTIYYYSMYDVLVDLLDQDKLTTNNIGARRATLFYLPQDTDSGDLGELFDLLSSTYPPDTLNFSQATWYEVLTEIFRFYDAGFWFDENQKIHIEYYNDYESELDLDLNNKTIRHAEKDYSRKRVAFYQNAVEKVKSKGLPTRSQSLGVPSKEDYGLVLPYQIYDIEKLEYLLDNTFVTMPFDAADAATKGLYVNKWISPLDLSFLVIPREVWGALNKVEFNFSAGEDYRELTQKTTIPFDRGSNFILLSSYTKYYGVYEYQVLTDVVKIAISRFVGITGDDITHIIGVTPSPAASEYNKQIFNIEYTTTKNGKFAIETLDNQYNGEMLVNQGSGFVDLNKLGLAIFGETLKNGQPVLTAETEINVWENRPKEGDYIVYHGEKWVVNVVNYTLLNDDVYKCHIEFSKNFNALSLRVQSDKQKRLSAISRSISEVCEDYFIDYIYVSDNQTNWTTSLIGLPANPLCTMLTKTFANTDGQTEKQYISEVMQFTADNENDRVFAEWRVHHPSNQITNAEYTNLVIGALGLSLSLSVSVYGDPEDPSYSFIGLTGTIVSGTIQDAYDYVTFQLSYVWKLSTNYYNTNYDVKTAAIKSFNDLGTQLTEEYVIIPLTKYGAGNCLCFELEFNDPINGGNRLTAANGAWGTTNYFSKPVLYADDEGWFDDITIEFLDITSTGETSGFATYPLLDMDDGLVRTCGEIEKLHYLKKPNEVFALNYEWCFLPLPDESNDFFIGNAFINDNFFTNPEINKKFYISVGGGKYSILDVKAHGTSKKEVRTETVKFDDKTAMLYIILKNDASVNATTWCLCDENNLIYFASNHAKTFTNKQETTTILWFKTSQYRRSIDSPYTPIEPGVPYTYQFTVYQEDWKYIPSEYTINVSIIPTGAIGEPVVFILEDDNTTTALYTDTTPHSGTPSIWVGLTMNRLSITQEGAGIYTNTVSFDSATGTFSYQVYQTDWHTGDEIAATITYRTSTAISYYVDNYTFQVPYLAGKTLSSVSISPSSDVFGRLNTISFNSNTGTFSGTVYKSTNARTEYTITIVIE